MTKGWRILRSRLSQKPNQRLFHRLILIRRPILFLARIPSSPVLDDIVPHPALQAAILQSTIPAPHSTRDSALRADPFPTSPCRLVSRRLASTSLSHSSRVSDHWERSLCRTRLRLDHHIASAVRG